MIDDRSSRYRRQVISARSHLAREGDASEHCYILLSGTLARETILADGRRQITGLHVPGDVCGLVPVAGAPVPCNILALSDVTCVAICRHWLSSVLKERPDIRDAAWRETAREAAISAAWIANIGQRQSYPRVAHFICELAARWGTARGDDGSSFDWDGKQSDIGAALGLSLVHVNKTLRKLSADGIASVGKRATIHDMRKLGEVAGFDPDYLKAGGERLGALLSRIASPDTNRTSDPDHERSRFDPRPIPLRAAI